MHQLIQDLLAYSRVGRPGRELHDISSEEALEQALINLRGAIAESGAVVTHDPLPQVKASEIQLIQLFQNLVGNAIKYQEPGVPRIHISPPKSSGTKVNFSVKDNGLGIDSAFFERIFGMFQQLHKRGVRRYWYGIGHLQEDRRRARWPHLRRSEPGHGSTFHFAFNGSGSKS